MKKIVFTILVTSLFVSNIAARDDILTFSVAQAINEGKAKGVLDGSVKFYFGKQKHPFVTKKFGEFSSNKKTNAFGKSDMEACNWAFLSAMKSLQSRAKQYNANAIVNIKSNYKDNLTSSNKTFQCGAGAFIAGVALVGDVVNIKNR